MVYDRYGGPEVLRLADVPVPEPRDGQVLVKVHATSINAWDWDLLTGTPRAYRVFFGLTRPRCRIIGSDIAGRVEAVGRGVADFKPGDEVFGDVSGDGFGAFAEYARITASVLAHKPREVTFDEAAALPQAGMLALQALRLGGDVQSTARVLINGADTLRKPDLRRRGGGMTTASTGSAGCQSWNWATIPAEPIAPGIVRQMVYGERLMVCRLRLSPGTVTAAHAHVHEQMTIVERGRLRFVLGTEERVLGPGDIVLLPSGFWHGATMLDEEVVLIDIFSPLREEFLARPGSSSG